MPATAQLREATVTVDIGTADAVPAGASLAVRNSLSAAAVG